MVRKVKSLSQQSEEIIELMKQSPFMQKQLAKARQETYIEEFLEQHAREMAQATVNECLGILRTNILKVVQTRFPQLTRLAQQRLTRITKMKVLQGLLYELLIATDESV